MEGSFFSTSSPTLVIVVFLIYSHSSGCEVVSYCGFDLLLISSDVEHLFIILSATYMSFLQVFNFFKK